MLLKRLILQYNKDMLFIFLLILIEITLFSTNYKPGTYLIGWDNVMPEFNLLENFKRSLFGVWQDYRGLGLLDGMAHTANLLHTLYIWLLSLVVPQSMLRYLFLNSTHLIGGIAFYFLAKSFSKNNVASFLGALFYMFNLGILQLYYAPLEVFAVHFASLPFLALLTKNALSKPTKKHFLLLFLVALLTSPQAFVPTLFLVFLVLLSCQLFVHFLYTKKIKNIALICFVIFAANAFWLLPYAYSTVKNANIIPNTKINQFSSEEIFFRNKSYGNLKDTLRLKGFMLDTVEYNTQTREHMFFMENWRNHFNSPSYQMLFTVIAIVALIGILSIVIRRKEELLPFVITFIISLFFLANNTPLLKEANTVLREFVPLVGEAFRFPFTKFITVFAFCFALFFTQGFIAITNRIKQVKLTAFILIFLVLFLSYPAFLGYFFSPLLKLSLPNEYIEIFSYLNKQDSTKRIALLPVHTFWNWQYLDWGHRGSGFLWYGIKQPILLRAFDPWSNQNEQFYNELSYALNIQDKNLFINTLDKYDISYLLVDTSTENAITRQPINYQSLLSFIEKSGITKNKNTFGKLVLYETSKNSFAYLIKPVKTSFFDFAKEDVIFNENGNYITGKPLDSLYLMPSLFTEKLQENNSFLASQTQDAIILSPKNIINDTPSGNLVLEIPSYFTNEFLIPVSITKENGKILLAPLYPKIYLNNQLIQINDTPITLELKSVKNPTKIIFSDTNWELDITKQTKGFIFNTYVNTIIVKDGNLEEKHLIDTSSVKQPPFKIAVNQKNIQELRIEIDKITSPFSIEKVIEKGDYKVQPLGLYTITPFKSFENYYKEGNSIFLEAKSSNIEFTFHNDKLPHLASYILFADTRYYSGLPMQFYIDNPLEKRPEVETRFSKKKYQNVIVIPKTEAFYNGYGFHFIVKSVGLEEAKASLENISVYPLPAATIQRIKLTNSSLQIEKSQKAPVNITKINPSLYIVSDLLAMEKSNNPTIVLSQSFDPDWKAYKAKNYELGIMNYAQLIFPFFFGSEIKEHVLVNNWANGWNLDSSKFKVQSSKFVIVYLPQYLQYFGFLILIGTPILLLASKGVAF